MSTRFFNLPVIIAAVFGLGLGASMYLNVVQHQRAESDKKLLQGEITDLRYQVKQDQTTVSPTASPAPSLSPSSSPSPTAEPAVAGTSSVTISQFGVKLTTSDPITDLAYAPQVSARLEVAGFTTESLVAKYPGCKPGTALGMLVRRPKSQKAPSWNKFIKTIDNYSYYYSAATTGNCAPDQAGRDALAAARAALVTTVLPTLSK